MIDDDLTPELRRALDALPREDRPSDLLEERTVRALHAHGLLVRKGRRGILMTPAMVATAAAVTVALMLGLFTLGQWIGSRQDAGPALASSGDDEERILRLVQETEVAHVEALAELARRSASASPVERARCRRVALRSFYAVADQMLALDPDDPLSARILQAFDQTDRDPLGGDARGRSQIVWF